MTSLLIVACSSQPAPWTRADTSPWSSKREAEKKAVESVESAEPVLIAGEPVEPEPLPDVTAEGSAPVQTETAVVVAPLVDEVAEEKILTPEERIMQMDPGNFAVQVYASSTIQSMDKFREAKGLEDLTVLKTNRGGEHYYVLVDLHMDKQDAQRAAGYLQQRTGQTPWVRSVAGLQKVVVVD